MKGTEKQISYAENLIENATSIVEEIKNQLRAAAIARNADEAMMKKVNDSFAAYDEFISIISNANYAGDVIDVLKTIRTTDSFKDQVIELQTIMKSSVTYKQMKNNI